MPEAPWLPVFAAAALPGAAFGESDMIFAVVAISSPLFPPIVSSFWAKSLSLFEKILQ